MINMDVFSNRLPLMGLDSVNTGELPPFITLRIEPRRVKITDSGPVSDQPNAWRYIRCGSAEQHQDVLETWLGPVINARRGQALTVHWVNTLGPAAGHHHSATPPEGPTQEMPPINPIPMNFNEPQWKFMNESVGIVTHLHGGKLHPDSDGWPLHPAGFQGNPYGFPSTRTYSYPNEQRAAMLWFHDHAMDNTSAQVHAGLAGLYFIRDESDDALFELIGGPEQEIPLVIQDRCLADNNTRVDYMAGVPVESANNPDDAAQMAFKRPEFLGNSICVNGRPWPFHELGRKVYRLRILNGSNARTYALALVRDISSGTAEATKAWYSDCLTVIGNDGGLFAQSYPLAATNYILLAPGERLDVLMDLTQVGNEVCRLNLVNLAINALVNPDPQDPTAPEPIFQNDAVSVLPPPPDAKDAQLLTDLNPINLSKVMQFCLCAPADDCPTPSLDAKALNQQLVQYAEDLSNCEEGFAWCGDDLTIVAANKPRRNRLILLMNNTAPETPAPPGTGPLRDTQIWEMTESADGNGFRIPFLVDLSNNYPAIGVPADPEAYAIARSSFFNQYPANRTVEQLPGGYDNVFTNPVIQPFSGSWERWYVANLGNAQPPTASNLPDMHPFHLHLVNFVVQKRYVLDQNASDTFVESSNPDSPNFDGKVRHDTVRIQANELVELLVYFPPGYTGSYPYHCHIVEHEDMGMMLHFDVQA